MTNNFTKIVAYDEHGNIYTLWDSSTWYGLNESLETNKEANPNFSPMPKLETGMFIILDLTNTERKEKHYGFIYGDRIIWQSGSWDELTDIHVDKRHEDDMKAKLTIYEKDKIYYFPKDIYKDYILWTGEVWYG